MGGMVSTIFGGGTKKAMKKGNALMTDMFQQGKDLLMPFASGGAGAFGAMGNMLGLGGTDAQNEGFNNYMKSTGTKFMLDTGSKAITGSAAAKGLLNSGATAKALTEFGQNLATTKSQQYFQNLGGMAQVGAGAAGNVAQSGNAMASNVAQNRMQNASNMADAWGSMFNLGLGIAGMPGM